MRTVGLVTTSRADWGICVPVAQRLARSSSLRLRIYVTGTHLLSSYDETVTSIEREFEVAARVPVTYAGDSPLQIATAMAATTAGFAGLYAREKPDILYITGDRFDMHAAALAAVPFNIPIAHTHGGETSLGAIDEGFRHSLTKISHLHFVATEQYARRVIQMGEQPWRVTVSGAPSLDNLATLELASREEMEKRYSFAMDRPWLLVTFHPATLEFENAERQVNALLGAVKASGLAAIFTAPNADTGSKTVRKSLEEYVRTAGNAAFVENFGTRDYMSAMKYATAMVGNSSSGMVEAPSFGLPVVNIGIRQQGRVRARNVIDTGSEQAEIGSAIRKAVSPAFRESLAGLENPYGSGDASDRIGQRLETVSLDSALLHKVFHDMRCVENQ